MDPTPHQHSQCPKDEHQLQQTHHLQPQPDPFQDQMITDDHHQQQMPNPSQNDNIDADLQVLILLVQEIRKTDNVVQSCRDLYQDFVIHLQTRSRYISSLQFAEGNNQYSQNNDVERMKRELAVLESVLKLKANQLTIARKQLMSNQSEVFHRLLRIQNRILHTYLPRWRHEQQLMNNGVQSGTIKLDTMQSCVERIVDIIWRIKNQIKGLQLTLADNPNVPFGTEELENFAMFVNRTLETMILNSFVVEKQPPQVMKTNTRFTSTLRLLCGDKLNVQMINPTVKALILSEQNARNVIQYHKQLIDNSRFSQEQFGPDMMAPTVSQSGSMDTLMTSAPLDAQIDTDQASQIQPQQFGYNPANFSETTDLTSTDGMLLNENPQHLIDLQCPQGLQFPTHHDQHVQQQQQQTSGQQATPNMIIQKKYNITEVGYNPGVPVHSKDFENSGEITNNASILEYHEASGQMICHFKAMQLKKIKRTEKKGTESVMDEKFVLLFYTQFRIADDSFWPYSMKTDSSSRVKRGDLLYHMLAFSLPVVVIVHGNQESHAWATVIWHNAFANQDGVLYKVPDRVPWHDLGNVLSEKIRSCAGRGLSAQNLRYLAGKVSRCHVDNDDVLVTWSQFAKEPLSDRSFTFWEWFHSILKLTKDYLSPLWEAERILGFISRKGCEDVLLRTNQVGTFMLRFSETELGGITIAWLSTRRESEDPALDDVVQIYQQRQPHVKSSSDKFTVMHVQPFAVKCLQTRSLADRIRDLKDLVFLYPNIPKDEAFGPYYTPIGNTAPRSNEGYVKSLLVTTLAKNYPGTGNTSAQSGSPAPPGFASQSSPESFNLQENMWNNEAFDPDNPPFDPYDNVLGFCT